MASLHKIVSIVEASEIVGSWKEEGLKVVFTNGCFDILHLGHVDYLEKAAQQGDVMVLALNSDDSVKRLKGPERPINNEYARARILASLEFVDLVVVFDEDTPLEIIKTIQPSILVKGDDYDALETSASQKKYIVGSDIVKNAGGEVKTISLVDGYSTTSIIERMKNR